MVWTRLHISQQVNQKSRGYVSYVPAIDLILWYIYQCRAQVLFFTKEIWSFTCQRDLSIQETKGRKWHLVFYSIRSFHNLNHFLCLEKNATHCTSVSTPRRCWYRAIHNIPSWDTKHLIMLAKLELENEQQLGWNTLFGSKRDFRFRWLTSQYKYFSSIKEYDWFNFQFSISTLGFCLCGSWNFKSVL